MPDPKPVVVKPEDELTIVIEIGGMIGADLTTVAGREATRKTLLTAATQQVDAWMESITVKEGR